MKCVVTLEVSKKVLKFDQFSQYGVVHCRRPNKVALGDIETAAKISVHLDPLDLVPTKP